MPAKTNAPLAAPLRALELPLLPAVPLALLACAYLDIAQSALLTALVALLALWLMFASYEASRPGLRDVMPSVVMGAVAAAGRILFAPIPDFKPVSAIAIMSGAVFGRTGKTYTGSRFELPGLKVVEFRFIVKCPSGVLDECVLYYTASRCGFGLAVFSTAPRTAEQDDE